VSKRDYTAEEWAILELVARSSGREFVERFAHLILGQARALGELEEEEDEPIVVDSGGEARK
jgi:hypothetical protein